jgi:hypothetical protein
VRDANSSTLLSIERQADIGEIGIPCFATLRSPELKREQRAVDGALFESRTSARV